MPPKGYIDSIRINVVDEDSKYPDVPDKNLDKVLSKIRDLIGGGGSPWVSVGGITSLTADGDSVFIGPLGTPRGKLHIRNYSDQLIIEDSDGAVDEKLAIIKNDASKLGIIFANDAWDTWASVLEIERSGINPIGLNLNTDLFLTDDKSLYLDTAKTISLKYDTAIGVASFKKDDGLGNSINVNFEVSGLKIQGIGNLGVCEIELDDYFSIGAAGNVDIESTSGDMSIFGSGGELYFNDSRAINILLSEDGTTGLVGFTAVSILGALNELKASGNTSQIVIKTQVDFERYFGTGLETGSGTTVGGWAYSETGGVVTVTIPKRVNVLLLHNPIDGAITHFKYNATSFPIKAYTLKTKVFFSDNVRCAGEGIDKTIVIAGNINCGFKTNQLLTISASNAANSNVLTVGSSTGFNIGDAIWYDAALEAAEIIYISGTTVRLDRRFRDAYSGNIYKMVQNVIVEDFTFDAREGFQGMGGTLNPTSPVGEIFFLYKSDLLKMKIVNSKYQSGFGFFRILYCQHVSLPLLSSGSGGNGHNIDYCNYITAKIHGSTYFQAIYFDHGKFGDFEVIGGQNDGYQTNNGKAVVLSNSASNCKVFVENFGSAYNFATNGIVQIFGSYHKVLLRKVFGSSSSPVCKWQANYSEAEIIDCTDNGGNGVVYMIGGGYNKIKVIGSTTIGNGGGINCIDSYGYNEFKVIGCSAQYGGGVYFGPAVSGKNDKIEVQGCSASVEGGGVYFSNLNYHALLVGLWKSNSAPTGRNVRCTGVLTEKYYFDGVYHDGINDIIKKDTTWQNSDI